MHTHTHTHIYIYTYIYKYICLRLKCMYIHNVIYFKLEIVSLLCQSLTNLSYFNGIYSDCQLSLTQTISIIIINIYNFLTILYSKCL